MAKKVQNFYWEVIPVKKAKELFKDGIEIYQLFDDDTESLIQDEYDFNLAIEWENEFAIQQLIN